MWQGDLVVLRPLERGDFPAVVRWSEDPELSSLVDGGVPETMEECEEWYHKAKSDRYHQIMAIVTKDGRLIGDIELNHITWRNGHAEMRIRIGEKEYWNRGFGTDAVLTLMRYVFTRLHLNRLYLRVYSLNHRAIACYEKCGFKKEGILRRTDEAGQRREIILMRVLREEFERHQGRPPKGSRRAG
ncbi:MAG: GNAT family N-acetyltransferase [Bacillota bacterium]|nr:GNAT family N-acetyltransferase [Bacillota bacterium]